MKIGTLDQATLAARIARANAIVAAEDKRRKRIALFREVNKVRVTVTHGKPVTGDGLGFLLHRAMLNGEASNR